MPVEGVNFLIGQRLYKENEGISTFLRNYINTEIPVNTRFPLGHTKSGF